MLALSAPHIILRINIDIISEGRARAHSAELDFALLPAAEECVRDLDWLGLGRNYRNAHAERRHVIA